MRSPSLPGPSENKEELEEKALIELASVPLSSIRIDNPNTIVWHNLNDVIDGMRRGGARTYLEEIQLAGESAVISLLVLVPIAAYRFFQTQQSIADDLNNNIYFRITLLPEVREAVSVDGATLSSEGAILTTTIVLNSLFNGFVSAPYKLGQYFYNRGRTRSLISLLKNHHYTLDLKDPSEEDAEEIDNYSLNDSQIRQIESLIYSNKFDRSTVIVAAPWFKHFLDMQWFTTACGKYISLFLFYPAIIVGTGIMIQKMTAISDKINCGIHPLWTIFKDACPVFEQYENMTFMVYPWILSSATWFSSNFLVILAGMLLFLALYDQSANLRKKIYQKVEVRFSTWWDNQPRWLYYFACQKALYLSVLPLYLIYALYSTINFLNEYTLQTDCIDPLHVLSSYYLQKSHENRQCGPAQIGMAFSGYVSYLEFTKLSVGFLSINILAGLYWWRTKCHPYFKMPGTIARTNSLLKLWTPTIKKIAIGGGLGVLFAGAYSFLPARWLANQILQTGFEVFHRFNGDPRSFFNPAFIPLDPAIFSDLLPDNPYDIPIAEIINQADECTISTTIPFPEMILGNISLAARNVTVPCIEILKDGLVAFQITQACPTVGILSIYYKRIFGGNIACNTLLVQRAIAGFIAPYWGSVSTGFFAFAEATGIILYPSLIKKTRAICRGEPQENPRPRRRSGVCGIFGLFGGNTESERNEEEAHSDVRNGASGRPGSWSSLMNYISGVISSRMPEFVALDEDAQEHAHQYAV